MANNTALAQQAPAAAPAAATTPAAASAGPGFMQDKRQALLKRIETMSKSGTNTKTAMQYFEQIEGKVKAGDEKMAAAMIGSLSRNLDEQEKARQQAGAPGLRQEIVQLQSSLQSKMAMYIATRKKLPFGVKELTQAQQLIQARRFADAKKLLQTLNQKLR